MTPTALNGLVRSILRVPDRVVIENSGRTWVDRPGLAASGLSAQLLNSLFQATRPDLEGEDEIGRKQQLLFIGAAVKGL